MENKSKSNESIEKLIDNIIGYLLKVQVMDKESSFYGAFYSEKAYHFPALDYNAGGTHHYRTVGPAGLSFLLLSRSLCGRNLAERAEMAFDWVVKQQCADGGFYEVSNNDVPSLQGWTKPDNSMKYPYPRSTIETAFVVYGLSQCMVNNLLPAKYTYEYCLREAAEWQFNMERPRGSGIFVHDESHLDDTNDCLNAATFAALTMVCTCKVLNGAHDRRLAKFWEAAERAVYHVVDCQEVNGEFRYLAHEGRTIAYTAVVVDSLLKIEKFMPLSSSTKDAIIRAIDYLKGFIMEDGKLDWTVETSASRYATSTYLEVANILLKTGYEQDARRLVNYCQEHLYNPTIGLLSVNDGEKEQVYHCAPFQADFLSWLLEMQETSKIVIG